MTPQQAVDEASARRGSLSLGRCPGEASLGRMPVTSETSDRWTDSPLCVPGTGNPALSRSCSLGLSPKGTRGCGNGVRCAIDDRRHLGDPCRVGRQWAPERSEQAGSARPSDGKGCDTEWERQQKMRCDCSGRLKGIERNGVCERVLFSRAARVECSLECGCACVSDLQRSVNAVQGRSKLNGQNLGTRSGC